MHLVKRFKVSALVAIAAVLAQNHQAQIWICAVAEQRQGADRDVDTLQSFQPAHEKDERPTKSDLPPRLGPIEGPEGCEVDSRRDDENAIRVRAISVDQLLAFVRCRNDEQVGLLRDLTLDTDPGRGLRTRAAGKVLILDQAQSVRDVRPAGGQLRPQKASDLS